MALAKWDEEECKRSCQMRLQGSKQMQNFKYSTLVHLQFTIDSIARSATPNVEQSSATLPDAVL